MTKKGKKLFYLSHRMIPKHQNGQKGILSNSHKIVLSDQKKGKRGFYLSHRMVPMDQNGQKMFITQNGTEGQKGVYRTEWY